jgi:enoyl-CoA hydratase/carnithine racemase
MGAHAFESYRNKYENVRMKREDGILEVALNTKGGSLVFNGYVHEALVDAFRHIGDDRDNHVVILTGTGEAFCAQISPEGFDFFTPTGYDKILREGTKLLENILDIQTPMIAAVNGPVTVHSEYALLCDIVLAAEEASFQDAAHPGVRHRAGRWRARRMAGSDRRDSWSILSAKRSKAQRGRSKGLRRCQRGP